MKRLNRKGELFSGFLALALIAVIAGEVCVAKGVCKRPGFTEDKCVDCPKSGPIPEHILSSD